MNDHLGMIGLSQPTMCCSGCRAYRARAVRDPRGLLAEFGTQLPVGAAIRVHDSTADLRSGLAVLSRLLSVNTTRALADQIHPDACIPMMPIVTAPKRQNMNMMGMGMVSEQMQSLLNSILVLAVCRYIVIPARPAGTEGWSEEQLAALVTRDSMIGVAPALTPEQLAERQKSAQ